MAKKKLSYEDAIVRIEEIAETLEEDDTTLEKSIELYKEGMELTLLCKTILDKAEKEVMELKKTFDGEYVLTKLKESGDE